MEAEVKVKSLYKALKILECFTVKEPELGITELSEKLGLYKSNVHNIVSTFEKAGFIEKNIENDKYHLGIKILELAHVISTNISFRKIVLPYMQEISDKTNETVYLGIPNEGQVVYLDAAYPRSIIPTRSMLGEKAPMYCTAIGKAMLACFDDVDIKNVILDEMKRFTENTITDQVTFMKEVDDVRKKGYAIDNMEHEYGIKCIGMSIRDRKDKVVAGISISGPSLRFSDDRIVELAQILAQSIKIIQERLS